MRLVRAFLISAAIFGYGFAENQVLPQREGYTNLGHAPITSDSTGKEGSARTFYWLSNVEATWQDAFAACNSQAGRLVSISNPVMNEAVRDYLIGITHSGNVWIGAKQTGSNWFWPATNIPMTYKNWRATSCETSSNLCAYATGAGAGIFNWCSASCTNRYRYLCEA